MCKTGPGLIDNRMIFVMIFLCYKFYRGCHRQPLFSFQLLVCDTRPVKYSNSEICSEPHYDYDVLYVGHRGNIADENGC